MNKIRIIDTYSCFHFHEMFNSAFLVKIVLSKKNLSVSYYADKSNWDNIVKIISDNNIDITDRISFKAIKVFPKSWNSLGLLLRNILGAIKNVYYFLTATPNETIIYFMNNPISIYILNFLAKRKKSKSIYIVCHGEIELLIKNFSIKQPSFWYKKLYDSFFRNVTISINLKFIILGGHIRDQLLKKYPRNSINNFCVVDHPYLFSDVTDEIQTANKGLEPFRLGVIGTVSANKGFNDLLALADRLKKQIDENKIEIYVIGSHSINVKDYPHLRIISITGEALETSVYNNSIKKLDYILFFYKSPFYSLTASGAIFDAVQYRKPIISLTNDYFEYVFRVSAPFGYLEKNIDEMENVINHILETKNLDGDIFKKNINIARDFFNAKKNNKV